MTRVKIQIKGTRKNGSPRTFKEICDELRRIADETDCEYNFEGLHPQNETKPFIWVNYSGGTVFQFVIKLVESELYERNCSLVAGVPGIDSLPT